jgi:hypothetical protein
LKIRQKPALSHQNGLSKSGSGAAWVNESTSPMRRVSLKQDRIEDGANSNNNSGSTTVDADDSVRTMRPRCRVSRCTIIADSQPIVFNACPRFYCNSTALESRIRVFKLRTNFRLKFVRGLDARVAAAIGQTQLSLMVRAGFGMHGSSSIYVQ